jgi:DNA-binding LacI/PurR family transcriptional regulator
MRVSVNPESAVPLHVQLLDQIRHLILSGEWAPGSRLPSEADLRRDLQISRGTIRQALQNAETEGLIERAPSKGTFVAQTPSREAPLRLIGFITSDFLSDHQRQLLRGAEQLARSRGYGCLFSSSGQDLPTENRLLDRMVADHVRGMLIWPIYEDAPSRRLFELGVRCDPPMVLMDRTLPGLLCDSVASDNYAGAFAATQHLIQLGHRRIVFLTRPLLELSTIADRLRGHRDALQEAGCAHLEPWCIEPSLEERGEQYALHQYSSAGTSVEIAAIAERLQMPQPPTAIFAMNDLTALLALKAASLAHLSVPRDLSLVGFDDMDFVTFLPIPLTTVAQDTFALGQRAAELLIERIEGYEGPPRSELIPTHLRERESTAPPPVS